MAAEKKKKNASFAELDLGPTGRIVADNIKRIRGDMSYNTLSARLEEEGNPIPAVGLRRIEAYARRVSVDDLFAISVVLGVPPSRLLLGNSNHQPFGTAVPEDATFSEVAAWTEGQLEDFSDANRWRYWARREAILIKKKEESQQTADKYARNAAAHSDDPQSARMAKLAQASLERDEAQYEEALQQMERLRLTLDSAAND